MLSPFRQDWATVSVSRDNKALVRRLVDEVVNSRDESAIDELVDGEFADKVKGWIGPFRDAFPDFRMEIVELIAEGDSVAAHFHCSGTHRGEWRGVAPTGRRFENVDEIYIFQVRDGRIAAALGLEDNAKRTRQLGIEL
jgi:predicted ester cyclase